MSLLTPEEWLAAGLKFVAALPVLRWPLAGALIAILADNLDVVGWRGALILLPNFFETLFLYVCMRMAWLPDGPATARRALLAGLVAYKVVQEIALHGIQVMDRYNLKDVLERIL